MPKNDVMVSKRPDGWAVTVEGNNKASKITDTQKQAIDYGKHRAQDNKSELRIQGTDGKIRETRSYGNDPCPPKDKK